MNIMENKKTKIGLVQMNNSFFKQNYIPYSVGILQAYAEKYVKNIDDFEFLLPIYKRIKINEAIEKLKPASIVFFSVYVWNFNLSKEIAKKLKEIDKNKLIVFGGCHIPRNKIIDFMKENKMIDIACVGEGEIVIKEILENYKDKNWKNVPSIAYRSDTGNIIKNPDCERIKDLDLIPSPYLEGIFDPLIKSVHDETWIALWETNRGCPFGCSYCEWGGNYQKKLYTFSIDRLNKEIDWMSKNKIEFIFCCDSNFGIFDRDLEISKKAAENKRLYGYPNALSVQNTKNSQDRSYEIMKVLSDAKLSKGVNLAFQSMNPLTLTSVGRKNISNDSFSGLQKRFNENNIETFSDIILGLPEESYETYTKGIDQLIKSGQHNRIQFNNLSLLPNSEMGSDDYQKKYRIEYVKSKIINIHGSSSDEEVPEYQELVVSTAKMPKQDWIKARSFSFMISLLHFDKLLQIPFVIINRLYDISYKEIIEHFMDVNEDYPIFKEINDFFIQKSNDIQEGKEEFYKSEKWLNIWWPTDEYKIIDIFSGEKKESFYNEAYDILRGLLNKKNIEFDEDLLKEMILFNKSIIKLPLQDKDSIIELDYNIWEFYKSILSSKEINLNKDKFTYLIDKSSEKWSTWEEWCEKVVWWCNKRGAYIYNCKNIK
jgi:radical SAM superfamily enzyme YgiQ (UPF0313 family)